MTLNPSTQSRTRGLTHSPEPLLMLAVISCCCSVVKLCPTLGDHMDCSMPGFSVHHYLSEFAQTVSLYLLPSLCVCVCVCVCVCPQLLSRVQLFLTQWTVARQTPLSAGLLQARILKWVAMSSSRESSEPRDGIIIIFSNF